MGRDRLVSRQLTVTKVVAIINIETKQSQIKIMTTINEEKIIASIEAMQADIAKTRTDIEQMKDRLNALTTSQAVLVNDSK